MSQQSLTDKIEKKYAEYMENPSNGVDELYKLMFPYLSAIISPIIRVNDYVDQEVVKDIVQSSLSYILTEGLGTFVRKEAKFSTWSAVIAKNRAFDYVRQRNRHRLEYIEAYENSEKLEQRILGNRKMDTPESTIMDFERYLKLCELVKFYLHVLLNMDEKPYQLVSCCYTLILFHGYNPDAKELSSPKWAYEVLKDETVEFGAEMFVDRMKEWKPELELNWGEPYYVNIEKEEDGKRIGDIVFGERCKVKDFENWSRRMRDKIKKKLLNYMTESGIELE